MSPDGPTACARCGRALDPEDCFIVSGPNAGERAGLCRLEHIVPWVLRGAAWAGGGRADIGPLTVTRYRMGHEVVDEFDSAEELRAWASAGGRWARP